MKNLKKVLALVLAVVMIMGTVAVASAKDYTDVKTTDTYADAIDILSSLGILDGFTDGTFKPEGTLTRAQAAKMVAIVHNAATNGKIKGQDGISDLYGNAQNAFTDCTGNWAVAYINYCRATGLLDGITRTTYAPNSKLTGVQWLKLMLTTLNFDTNKEGYLGAGWDVNVLNRANEIGLTDGLAKGWKGNVPVTRGEAAQILYNALTKYLVEYGQLIKNGKVTLDKAFVANESVEATGFTLAAKMGIETYEARDIYGRPGRYWNLQQRTPRWYKFVVNKAALTYTTKTSACNILVDLGVAKTSKLISHAPWVVNGELQVNADGTTKFLKTFDHLKAHGDCDQAIGGQGVLTQVFDMGDDNYVITEIDTYLAKVVAVRDAKHGLNDKEVKFDFYFKTASKNDNVATVVAEGLGGLTKGSYVLLNKANRVDWQRAAKDSNYLFFNPEVVYVADTDYSVEGDAPAYINYVDVAPTFEGKLTDKAYNDTTITVDGTAYNTARQYSLSDSKLALKWSGTWFKDQYGNVIGDKAKTTDTIYGVVDNIRWTESVNAFDEHAIANLTTFDAKTSVVTVGKWNETLKGVETSDGNPSTGDVSDVAARNYKYMLQPMLFGVVAYTESNGVYTFTTPSNAKVLTMNDGKSVTKGNPTIGYDRTTGTNYLASDETIFLVRTTVSGANHYEQYVGYNALPSMSNLSYIVAVEDKYSDFVFIDATNAVFAGSTTEAYVLNTTPVHVYSDGTYDYEVWVDGAKQTIKATSTTLFTVAGLYSIEFDADTIAIKATLLNGTKYTTRTVASVGKNVIDNLNVTNAKAYLVDGGTITEYAVDAIGVGDVISIKFAAGSTYVVDTIYVTSVYEGF